MSDGQKERRDSRYDSLLEAMPELLKKYWYVQQTDEGLVFDFTQASDYNEVRPNHLALQFLDQIFDKTYYIKGFFKNRTLIDAVFEQKLPFKKPIWIGENLFPIRTLHQEYYTLPRVSNNGQEAVYEFMRLKMHKNRAIGMLNPDILMAHFWKHQVRYGFDYDAIVRGLKHNRQETTLNNPRIVIAKHRPPSPPTDAYRHDSSEKLCTDTRASIVDDDPEVEVDMYRFKNTIYHINAGEVLYQKHPAKLGKAGRDIFGNSISAPEPVDTIDLVSLRGEGTEIKHINGLESLVTSRDGTLRVESSGRVSVELGIVVKNVDGSTGNLHLDMPDQEMIVQGDIEDARKVTLHLQKLTVIGRVYGTVELKGKTNVVIEGGMTRARIIHRGVGQIFVKGAMLISRIEAPQCQVAIEMAEQSTIVARMAKIRNLFHSTAIARMVKIMEMQNTKSGRGYVSGEIVEIKSVHGGGEAGITCVWRREESDKTIQGVSPVELKRKESSLSAEIQALHHKNQKHITLYRNIEKLLSNPELVSGKQQQLLLQKRKLFSKVIQPLRDLESQREKVRSSLKAMRTATSQEQKKSASEYRIRIVENTFEGDLFVHAYEMDWNMKTIFSLGLEKLESIAQTSVVPAGEEGNRYVKIPIVTPLVWNHAQHIIETNQSK
jgi:hypothetical protein